MIGDLTQLSGYSPDAIGRIRIHSSRVADSTPTAIDVTFFLRIKSMTLHELAPAVPINPEGYPKGWQEVATEWRAPVNRPKIRPLLGGVPEPE